MKLLEKDSSSINIQFGGKGWMRQFGAALDIAYDGYYDKYNVIKYSPFHVKELFKSYWYGYNENVLIGYFKKNGGI